MFDIDPEFVFYLDTELWNICFFKCNFGFCNPFVGF